MSSFLVSSFAGKHMGASNPKRPGTLLRVSKEDLDRIKSTSIEYRDGGFAAGLGISHDLHCMVGGLFATHLIGCF